MITHVYKDSPILRYPPNINIWLVSHPKTIFFDTIIGGVFLNPCINLCTNIGKNSRLWSCWFSIWSPFHYTKPWSLILNQGSVLKEGGGGGTSYTMGVPLPPPKCHKNFTNFHPHCALVLRQILCWWTWNMVHHPNLHIKSTICISCLCAWVYSHCKWAYSSIGANRPRRTIPSIGSYVHTKALPKVQPIEIDGFIAHALTRTRCKALS